MDEFSAAVDLAKRNPPVLVASCDAEGQPHIASVGGMERQGEHWVALEEWLCPVTNNNIEANPRVAIVVRDESGSGFQLAGTVEDVEEMAIMNGFAPGKKEEAYPQAERKLVVRVEAVRAFSSGPHTDEPLV